MKSKYHIREVRKKWPRLLAIVLVAALLIGAAVIIEVRHVYTNDLRPLTSGQRGQTVTIPSGYSLKQVATLLKQKKLIRSDWAFSQYVRNEQADSDIKAGTYELSPSQSVQEIVSIITEGKIKTDLITILPGQRLDQIEKAFINSGFSQASVTAAFVPAQYAGHPALVDLPAGASLEGYLYPNTFQKTSTTSPEDIVREALDQMQQHLTPDIRAAFVAQGLTVHQAITLASVVEQEANTQTDRAEVAQVFYSRLHSGMRLESDVTAFYGAQIAGQAPSVTYDSPYNTYLHDGLPAGPISNVSDSSLQAVAHPASTNYLYFVAGDNGTVYYSQTLEEHQAQINQYCQLSCGH